MTKHITLFNTTTEYNNADLDLPNVSYTQDDLKVHYNPDPYNGHAYVEIGGLKWATMNVGATSETDYGLYFQWGDTQGYTASQVGSGEGQKDFSWANYKFKTSDDSLAPLIFFAKYNDEDGKYVLDIEDDAARANMGGQWRMPTTEELQALGNAVNAVWTENYNGSGINGLLCTDKTDSSKKLFFPAAGYADTTNVGGIGNEGNVWSSSVNGNAIDHAWYLYFGSGNTTWSDSYRRKIGFSVRGVLNVE